MVLILGRRHVGSEEILGSGGVAGVGRSASMVVGRVRLDGIETLITSSLLAEGCVRPVKGVDLLKDTVVGEVVMGVGAIVGRPSGVF